MGREIDEFEGAVWSSEAHSGGKSARTLLLREIVCIFHNRWLSISYQQQWASSNFQHCRLPSMCFGKRGCAILLTLFTFCSPILGA